MNPFNRDIGLYQGRILSASAAEGAYVYELGHALPFDANIAIGDFHEVRTTITLDAQTKVLRPQLRIITPTRLPTGAGWEVSCWLNATKLVSRRLRPSKRTLVLDDIRMSMAGALRSPTDSIAFRLELVA